MRVFKNKRWFPKDGVRRVTYVSVVLCMAYIATIQCPGLAQIQEQLGGRKTITIYHKFVDKIDKSVLRSLFGTFPQTHIGFFFLHTFGCQRLN